MELSYADENGIDQGEILDWTLDMAYGPVSSGENNFEIEVGLRVHCCKEDYRIYIEGTEYGGIVDAISPDTEKKTVTYSGRTWHGILENKIIEPPEDEDYLVLYGDANDILRELLGKLNLEDIFFVPQVKSGIEIVAYQMPRYETAYTGICNMLFEECAKLKMEYIEGLVSLTAEPLIDYSQDEEFNSEDLIINMKKKYNTVNHKICAGQGDLAERYVIHIFTDENGGIQTYAKKENPVCDEDYILDKSRQVLFGTKEMVEFYDYGNAQTTTNYVLLNAQPKDWGTNPEKYYEYIAEENKYEAAKEENGDVYTALNTQPGDWEEQYSSYYQSDGMGGYKSVEGVSADTYKRTIVKPVYWNKTYGNYYYLYSDGTTTEYRNVEGITKDRYEVQTRKPTDWSTNFGNYYKRKKKGGYEIVKGTGAKKKKAPAWKAKKYFTKKSKTMVPAWKNTYYSKTTKVSTPIFTAGKYFVKTTKYKSPPFAAGKYYEEVLDHYADMVQKAVEDLEKVQKNRDEMEVDLSANEEIIYDIGDIIGGYEDTTGIETTQPITKKIVKINGTKRPTITYEVGEKKGEI